MLKTGTAGAQWYTTCLPDMKPQVIPSTARRKVIDKLDMLVQAYNPRIQEVEAQPQTYNKFGLAWAT